MKRVAFVMTVLGVLGLAAPAFTEELPAMTIWKSPWCGCCGKWVEHMRAAGFEVQVNEVEDLSVVKRMAAVPNDLESCHTARVGGRGWADTRLRGTYRPRTSFACSTNSRTHTVSLYRICRLDRQAWRTESETPTTFYC
jgi:hypothetical protein